VNVWEYGAGFFLLAIEEHQKIVQERLKETAMAVRMAQANTKCWTTFLSA